MSSIFANHHQHNANGDELIEYSECSSTPLSTHHPSQRSNGTSPALFDSRGLQLHFTPSESSSSDSDESSDTSELTESSSAEDSSSSLTTRANRAEAMLAGKPAGKPPVSAVSSSSSSGGGGIRNTSQCPEELAEIGDRYIRLEEIGEGTYSTVYRGTSLIIAL